MAEAEGGSSPPGAAVKLWLCRPNLTGQTAAGRTGLARVALSLELKYAPDEKKEILLKQFSNHCSGLLAKAHVGQVVIPDDNWLDAQGFSPFYTERLEFIADVSGKLPTYTDSQQRKEFIEVHLQQSAELLSEVANGPNAVNLQTAVDTAKSAKGIDTDLHNFVEALQYKKDDFRLNKNNPSIYMDGKEMPTSVNEPVSWGVQSVNRQYGGAVLQEREHKLFQGIFPKGETQQQKQLAKTIIQTSSALTKQAAANKARHRQRRPEDQKPTAEITLSGGRRLTLQNIADAQGKLPIWRADGLQPNWTIRIKQDIKATEQERFPAQLVFVDSNGAVQAERIGYVSPESAAQHQLSQKFQRFDQKLTISAPVMTMQVPWGRENDSKMLFAQRDQYLERSLAPPAGKDPQIHSQEMALALWRQSKGGRKLVMQEYPEMLSDRLRTVPEIKIGRLQISSELVQRLVDKNPHTIQFAKDRFPSQGGEVTVASVSVLKADGDRFLIGAVSDSSSDASIALPEGATYLAAFSQAVSEKIVNMQVMDLPTVEQTPVELSAIATDDRTHLTFDGEPHADYGIREGQVALAQAAEGGEQIALRVGSQHRIDPQLLAREGAIQHWSEVENQPSSALFEKLAAARSDGKELWGLNVEALGTYERGQIKPLEQLVLEEQQASTVEPALLPLEQPFVEKAELPKVSKSSPAPSGVMAAIARANPAMQQLEQSAAESSSAKREQGAIANGPESNTRSQSAGKSKNAAKQANNAKATQPNKSSTQRRRRSPSKDNGIGD